MSDWYLHNRYSLIQYREREWYDLNHKVLEKLLE
jgi:hypothetical protein